MRSAVRFSGRLRNCADHGQVLQAGQVRIQVRLLRHVAHALLVGDRVGLDALPLEEDLAIGHLDQTGDHLHRGRLTGAVGSEVTGHLAGASDEADIPHRGNAGEAFGDMTKLEHSGFIISPYVVSYNSDYCTGMLWTYSM